MLYVTTDKVELIPMCNEKEACYMIRINDKNYGRFTGRYKPLLPQIIVHVLDEEIINATLDQIHE